jgi:hypothetical protein
MRFISLASGNPTAAGSGHHLVGLEESREKTGEAEGLVDREFNVCQ